MESLYLLIPVAIIFAIIVIRLLLWAIDSGQYDDLDKEGWRILADEDSAEDNDKGTRTNDRSTNTNNTNDTNDSNKHD